AELQAADDADVVVRLDEHVVAREAEAAGVEVLEGIDAGLDAEVGARAVNRRGCGRFGNNGLSAGERLGGEGRCKEIREQDVSFHGLSRGSRPSASRGADDAANLLGEVLPD